MRDQHLQRPRGSRTVYPLAIILSPTRELASQIRKTFTCQTGVKVIVVYGGTPINQQETDGLKDALGNEILKLKDQLGSRQKAISFFERDNSSNYLIPACIEIPTDETDEWEICVKQHQIEKKVASWFIWGDLHRGTYCSQEVAIKFLKPERVNVEMLREFFQEVYIMSRLSRLLILELSRVQIESGVMTAETGTYRWMATEVIEHKPYSHKADMFSYGIVIWELLTGHIPYAYLTPLQAAVGVVQKGLRPKIPKKTHPKVKGLLQRCWNQDPKDRPEFEEIIEMLQQIMIEVNVVP
ncbi:unnamed protein product [Brassica napus]|uniref:(rape) hypothetical protein n=1 Tax=Brassica napus TaxID=3708 RepID=A0A816S1Z8_BRANA|nr:unnamed protein product [Brassica napus]